MTTMAIPQTVAETYPQADLVEHELMQASGGFELWRSTHHRDFGAVQHHHITQDGEPCALRMGLETARLNWRMLTN